MRVLKIAFLAGLAVFGSAVAAHAQVTVTAADISPAPRSVTGLTDVNAAAANVVPISGSSIATFDLTFSDPVTLIVQVRQPPSGQTCDACFLKWSNNTTISTSSATASFSLSFTNSALQDQDNQVKFWIDVGGSGSTSSDIPVGDPYIVYVDRVSPNAPSDIRAEGADQIIIVNWDAPAKPSGFEQIVNYTITYSETDFSTMTTAQAEALPSTTAKAVGANKATIEGLENNKTYYISMRSVDWVGNKSNFPKNSSGGILTVSAQPVVTLSLSELAGEKGGCFIATAAYGSYQEPHVQILRQFRDRILLRSEAGAQFVDWYYRASPAYALWIAKHDTARAIVRLFLLPLYAFAYLMLNPLWALLAGLLLIGIGAARYALPRREVAQ